MSNIGHWDRGNLRINIDAAGCKGVDGPTVQRIIMDAYMQYQNAVPFFFLFTQDGTASDIRVQFGGTELDPRLGVPGETKGIGMKPPDGHLFLDAGTDWDPDHLFAIVLHEAGHTLGLSHSTSPTSIMYPFVRGLPAMLDPETIGAIQRIYGWLPQTPLRDRASTDGPSLALLSEPSFGGPDRQVLFMAWKGSVDDSGLYFSSSEDGVHWSSRQQIEGVGSSNGPDSRDIPPTRR